MHDIQRIRDHTEAFDAAMKQRGLGAPGEEILLLDKDCRNIQTKRDALLAERNQLSREIGERKKQGDAADDLTAKVQDLKNDIAALETAWQDKNTALVEMLEILPNCPTADVPDGADENDNRQIRTFGEPKTHDFTSRQHFDIGEDLGLLDFPRAARMSGARFAVKYGDLAKLERALAAFMLDTHCREHGYREVDAPVLVNGKTLYGSGHLPKFIEDLYKIDGDDLWLIPTSEAVLANLAADEILNPQDFPMRFTAWTQCFRSEAGAAGRDTRGLIRMHQFSKVELVSIVDAEQSNDELERMTQCAETILQKLDLPYRTMLLCVGDMGFAAAKTYDIEVWLPGAGAYREISSCSNCLDFQARRMDARVKRVTGKGTEFPHMLNGSGLAVGRTMVAILENYQNQDGTVTIPENLRPFMNGQTRIEKHNSR